MRSTCPGSHAPSTPARTPRQPTRTRGNHKSTMAPPRSNPRVPAITRRVTAKSCPKAVTLPCTLTRFARVFTAADAFRCVGERGREFRTLNGELAVAFCPRSAIRRFRIRGTVPCACRPLLNSATTQRQLMEKFRRLENPKFRRAFRTCRDHRMERPSGLAITILEAARMQPEADLLVSRNPYRDDIPGFNAK
jgi:hypothetical protein